MSNRNDWITSPPTLDRWEVRVTPIASEGEPLWQLDAYGYCWRKRGPIWAYSEVCGESDGAMYVSDVVHHLALVCMQDKPASRAALEAGLVGEAWVQDELPF